MIEIDDVWNYTTGAEDIVVAVIDSGIKLGSAELPNATKWTNTQELNGQPGRDDDNNGYIDDIYGYDFHEYDPRPYDETSGTIHPHGSYVAGIISAAHNNQSVAGVAPGIKLMDIRVLSPSSSFTGYQRIYDAFRYAIDNGASVINFSVYFNQPASDQLREIFQEANDAGIPIVGITGNDGYQTVSPPGTEPTIMAIGAVSANRAVAHFSNRGDEVELVAPGNFINTIYGNQVFGTSFAAPHVAGVIALMKSIYDLKNTTTIRSILTSSATDIEMDGVDDLSGHGLLNASKAMEYYLDSVVDVDGDGLNVTYELELGTDPNNPDSDFDSLTDWQEVEIYGTSPLHNDSDADGLPDGIEIAWGYDPTMPGEGELDPDGDGLVNTDEYRLGSMYNVSDTDQDGLDDGQEAELGTSPIRNDTDGDTLTDLQEIEEFGTDPTKKDTDGDSVFDASELFVYNTSAILADTDGDGLADNEEIFAYRTNPNNADSDADGMPDGYEISHDFDPLSALDANEDADSDGLTNLQEYNLGSDPHDADDPSTSTTSESSLPFVVLLALPVIGLVRKYHKYQRT